MSRRLRDLPKSEESIKCTIERLTLVGRRPMKSLSSVCLSVRLSARPSVTKFSQDWMISFF